MDFSGQGIVRLSSDLLSSSNDENEKIDDKDSLNLSNNRLFQLDDGIQKFSQIRHLDLSFNKLIDINGIECLEKLESLNLSHNNLSNMDRLGGIKNMKKLDLSHNNLTLIDDFVFENFQKMEKIDLSYNYIKKWPNLHTLNQLKWLNVSGNLLCNYEKKSKKLPVFLKELDLKENHLDQMTSLFGISCDCQELEKIKIDGNPFLLCVKKEQINLFLSICFSKLFQVDDQYMTQQNHVFKKWKQKIAKVYEKEGKKSDLSLMEILDEIMMVSSSNGSIVEPVPHTPLSPPPPTTTTVPKHMFKVEQVSPPDVMLLNKEDGVNSNVTSSDNSTGNNSTMSKQDKLNVWKRIQEEKQQQKPKSSFGGRSTLTASVHLHQPQPPLLSSSMVPVPSSVHPNPTQQQPLSSSSFLSLQQQQQQQQQIHFLQEQLNSMRKYMNIWIKREQNERTKAATKIQKWYRHVLQWHIFHRRVFLEKRAKKQILLQKYSFVQVSSYDYQSTTDNSFQKEVMLIQKHIRGYLTRQRIFQFYHLFTKNAIKIQKQFRLFLKKQQKIIDQIFSFTIQRKLIEKYQMDRFVLYQIARPFEEVGQVQRLCLVQEETIEFLWQEIAQLKKEIKKG